jgi:LPS export ABC transporter protein LptC/lipopolysaccharide transport protein LptA
MTRRTGIILGLLLVILVIEIIIVWPGELGRPPGSDENTEGHLSEPGQVANGQTGQEMTNGHLMETKEDGMRWELWAKKATRPMDNADWTIEKVKVKFYADKGVYYTVTGDKGHVNTAVNDLQISGHVLTESSNGYTFRTDEAFYSSKKRELSSPNLVTMVGPQEPDGSRLNLTGENMLADLNNNKIDIGRNVHAKKKIKDAKTAIITSDRAQFSGKSKYARFMGDVVIDVETLRITGPEATFSYKPGTETIDSMVVSGGVKVTDVDKYATANQVAVQFSEEKFIFDGAPRVVQGGDELRGDQIVFLDGGKKVQVSNGKAKLDSASVEKGH